MPKKVKPIGQKLKKYNDLGARVKLNMDRIWECIGETVTADPNRVYGTETYGTVEYQLPEGISHEQAMIYAMGAFTDPETMENVRSGSSMGQVTAYNWNSRRIFADLMVVGDNRMGEFPEAMLKARQDLKNTMDALRKDPNDPAANQRLQEYESNFKKNMAAFAVTADVNHPDDDRALPVFMGMVELWKQVKGIDVIMPDEDIVPYDAGIINAMAGYGEMVMQAHDSWKSVEKLDRFADADEKTPEQQKELENETTLPSSAEERAHLLESTMLPEFFKEQYLSSNNELGDAYLMDRNAFLKEALGVEELDDEIMSSDIDYDGTSFYYADVFRRYHLTGFSFEALNINYENEGLVDRMKRIVHRSKEYDDGLYANDRDFYQTVVDDKNPNLEYKLEDEELRDLGEVQVTDQEAYEKEVAPYRETMVKAYKYALAKRSLVGELYEIEKKVKGQFYDVHTELGPTPATSFATEIANKLDDLYELAHNKQQKDQVRTLHDALEKYGFLMGQLTSSHVPLTAEKLEEVQKAGEELQTAWGAKGFGSIAGVLREIYRPEMDRTLLIDPTSGKTFEEEQELACQRLQDLDNKRLKLKDFRFRYKAEFYKPDGTLLKDDDIIEDGVDYLAVREDGQSAGIRMSRGQIVPVNVTYAASVVRDLKDARYSAIAKTMRDDTELENYFGLLGSDLSVPVDLPAKDSLNGTEIRKGAIDEDVLRMVVLGHAIDPSGVKDLQTSSSGMYTIPGKQDYLVADTLGRHDGRGIQYTHRLRDSRIEVNQLLADPEANQAVLKEDLKRSFSIMAKYAGNLRTLTDSDTHRKFVLAAYAAELLEKNPMGIREEMDPKEVRMLRLAGALGKISRSMFENRRELLESPNLTFERKKELLVNIAAAHGILARGDQSELEQSYTMELIPELQKKGLPVNNGIIDACAYATSIYHMNHPTDFDLLLISNPEQVMNSYREVMENLPELNELARQPVEFIARKNQAMLAQVDKVQVTLPGAPVNDIPVPEGTDKKIVDDVVKTGVEITEHLLAEIDEKKARDDAASREKYIGYLTIQEAQADIGKKLLDAADTLPKGEEFRRLNNALTSYRDSVDRKKTYCEDSALCFDAAHLVKEEADRFLLNCYDETRAHQPEVLEQIVRLQADAQRMLTATMIRMDEEQKKIEEKLMQNVEPLRPEDHERVALLRNTLNEMQIQLESVDPFYMISSPKFKKVLNGLQDVTEAADWMSKSESASPEQEKELLEQLKQLQTVTGEYIKAREGASSKHGIARLEVIKKINEQAAREVESITAFFEQRDRDLQQTRQAAQMAADKTKQSASIRDEGEKLLDKFSKTKQQDALPDPNQAVQQLYARIPENDKMIRVLAQLHDVPSLREKKREIVLDTLLISLMEQQRAAGKDRTIEAAYAQSPEKVRASLAKNPRVQKMIAEAQGKENFLLAICDELGSGNMKTLVDQLDGVTRQNAGPQAEAPKVEARQVGAPKVEEPVRENGANIIGGPA